MKRIIRHWLFNFQYLFLLVFIFAVYTFAGKIGLSFAFLNASATAIWPPTGVALAAILLFGLRVWPAIYLGAFFVNLTTQGGVVSSIGIAGGNTLEALAGAFLVTKFANGKDSFRYVSDLLKFSFLAGFVSTAISATIGVAILFVGGFVLPHTLSQVWFTWWLGDAGGALLVAPFILLWFSKEPFSISIPKFIKIVVYLGVIAIFSQLIFSGAFPYPYMAIPVFILGAFTFGRREELTALLVFAFIAIFNTIHGNGPYTNTSGGPNGSLVLLDLYLGILSLTTLMVVVALMERKLNKKILQQRELRFKALIEKSFDAVVLIDTASNILYASPSVKKVLGYDPQELIGKTGFNLVAPEDRKRTTKELAGLILKPNGVVTVEYKTIKKDGSKIWVEATGTNLLLDANVNAVVVNFRDITQRKIDQQEIENSEKRFKALIEKSAEGIALIDSKGKILYTSSSTERILGYKPEEYTKLNANSIIHPDDLKRIRKESASVTKPNATVSIQYRVKNKKGEYRWLDVVITNLTTDSSVGGYVINFRDITDRKEDEQKLAQEKAEDEAMIGSIGEGIIATDSTGRIMLVNEATTKMLEFTEKDLIGESLLDAVEMLDENENVIDKSQRPISKVLASGKSLVTSKTNYYVTKSNNKLPIAFTLTPIVLDGKVVGTVEVFRDITEEQRIDRAKNEFVSLASHQLRTPLTTINWYVERLESGEIGKVTDKQGKYLDQVYKASRRMVSLVNALLNVSRLELGTFTVEPKEINVSEIAQDVVAEIDPQLKEKKINLEKRFQKNMPHVYADPKLLNIILENLLSNAMKYSAEGGKILFDISFANKQFVIKVADTGLGIAKKDQEKIFTKMFRADNAKMFDPEGNGLGLYIVQSILEKTGGKIEFTSAEKKGTTFTVTFPEKGMKEKKGTTSLH